MYIDAQHLFSDSQALVATAVSTNIYDSQADRDIGIGTPMAIVMVVKVLAVTAGTLTVELQTDDNVGMATPTVIATSGPLATAVLTAGAKFVIPIPPDRRAERYFRINYVIVTITTVTVTTFLTRMDMIQNESYYADAITIS